MDNESIKILLCNRFFLYTYCGRAFASAPDENLLEIATAEHTLDECSLLCDSQDLAIAVQREIGTLAKDEGALERLQSDYIKLLIGPGKLPASPWESVYVTGESLVFQKCTLEVRQAYHAQGFESTGYPKEPDDHIATELNFMAALAKKTLKAFAADDQQQLKELFGAQQSFLEEHLLVWLPQFADDMEKQTTAGRFFPLFAKLSLLVCVQDRFLLEDLMKTEFAYSTM